jgi:hypothetical protein
MALALKVRIDSLYQVLAIAKVSPINKQYRDLGVFLWFYVLLFIPFLSILFCHKSVTGNVVCINAMG